MSPSRSPDPSTLSCGSAAGPAEPAIDAGVAGVCGSGSPDDLRVRSCPIAPAAPVEPAGGGGRIPCEPMPIRALPLEGSVERLRNGDPKPRDSGASAGLPAPAPTAVPAEPTPAVAAAAAAAAAAAPRLVRLRDPSAAAALQRPRPLGSLAAGAAAVDAGTRPAPAPAAAAATLPDAAPAALPRALDGGDGRGSEGTASSDWPRCRGIGSRSGSAMLDATAAVGASLRGRRAPACEDCLSLRERRPPACCTEELRLPLCPSALAREDTAGDSAAAAAAAVPTLVRGLVPAVDG